MLNCIVLYDVNITNLAIGEDYNRRMYKGVFHDDVTFQHPLFVNNSNNNHYFTNYSTYNRSVSTNDHRNSETNCLTNE